MRSGSRGRRSGLTAGLCLVAAVLAPGRPAGTGPAAVPASILSSLALSDKSVIIVWEDNDTAEISYSLLRSTNPPTKPFKNILTLEGLKGTGNTYYGQNNGLKKSTTYHFKVRTNGAGGFVDTEEFQITTLPKGQNLLADLLPDEIELTAAVGESDEEFIQFNNPLPFILEVTVTRQVDPPFQVANGSEEFSLVPGNNLIPFRFEPTVVGRKTDKWKATIATPLAETKVTVKLAGQGTAP
jgi:hypothetical protein